MPDVHGSGYIQGFGNRKKGQKGHLSIAGGFADPFYDQIASAKMAVDSNKKKGPYSLDNPRIISMAQTLRKGTTDLHQLLEVSIDTFRPIISQELEWVHPRIFSNVAHKFFYNPEFSAIPEELATAGVLIDESRKITVGSLECQILTHIIEPFILAVAALRANGLDAYPGMGNFYILDKKTSSPLIVLFNMESDNPLTVFTLMRDVVPYSEIEIIRDAAINGVLHASLAETMAKKFAVEMVEKSKNEQFISNEEIEAKIKSIAKELYLCHVDWPGSKFVYDALSTLAKSIMEAIIAKTKFFIRFFRL